MKKNRRTYCIVVCTVVVGMFFGSLLSPAISAEATDEQLLVDKARITFESFMSDSNMSFLKEHLKEAKGILIVPSLLKAGFIFGGSGGSGVLIVNDAKKGQWSQPAFYTIGSVSFGLQIGGESAEVIMMVRTQKAVDKLLTSSFKLGGDTSVAAGPVGVGAKSNVMADIFSFSRSQGAFAGLALDGSVITTRDKWNAAYYGKPVSPVDILVTHSVSNPGSAELRQTVAKYAK
ncbi:MAG: lipid-binding SYLF domain-containing protein [Desulfobacterales bacterium]